MSPVSNAPLLRQPPDAAGQCKTVPPSKCPPQLINVSPPQSDTVVPSQKGMRGLSRMTHCRSAACKKICASKWSAHSTIDEEKCGCELEIARTPPRAFTWAMVLASTNEMQSQRRF